MYIYIVDIKVCKYTANYFTKLCLSLSSFKLSQIYLFKQCCFILTYYITNFMGF